MTKEKFFSLLESLTPQLTSYVLRIVGVLVVLWIAFKLARWLQRRLSQTLVARGLDQTLATFFATIVRWLVALGAVFACLGVFGIETTTFAAVLGAAGFAIGMAFKGTLANFSSGVMLVVFKPFKVGDVVVVAGKTGKVVEVGTFVTTIDTADNRRITIPNNQVAGTVIENISHHEFRRVDIDVGVVYAADIDQTREVLDKAAAGVPSRDDENGHQVVLKGLGASSVDWAVRVWCKSEDYWDVWQATIRAVKLALEQAGIDMPFPQMDVHLDGGVSTAA